MFSKKGQPIKKGTFRSPKLVEELKSQWIIQIAAGTGHNLALTESKKVYSWGNGTVGQCGFGSEHLDYTSSPKLIDYSGNVISIAAGA